MRYQLRYIQRSFFQRDCKYRYSIPKKQEEGHLFFGRATDRTAGHSRSGFRLGGREGLLAGLQGGLEGRGGAEAPDAVLRSFAELPDILAKPEDLIHV